MIDRILLMCCVTATAAFFGPGVLGSGDVPGSQAAEQDVTDAEGVYLGVGDRVEVIDAFHPEELGTTAVVAEDGTVGLPELGFVQVAGLTRAELQALLMEKYSVYYDLVDIEVRITPSRKSYYLFGEVNEEGQREFEGDLTIWEAVMLNNPKLESANLGRVRLIRPDPTDPMIITVDIAQMLATGDTTYNVHVSGRDLVYVPPDPQAELSVREHLEGARAGMDTFARNASAEDAEYVQKLISMIEVAASEFERVAR